MTEDTDSQNPFRDPKEKEISDTLKNFKGKDWDKKVREMGYKPGQALFNPVTGTPYGPYVPWVKEDLDPSDRVTFVAQNVLGSQGGVIYGENGKRSFILDVNGLTCGIVVGELNTVNRFFYSRYEAMVNDNIKLEEFKRGGPRSPMPWDPKNWFYMPYAASFGMDIDGRYLRDPKWFELDKNGIPVKINNMQKIVSLYFEGDLDFTFTKLQVAELALLYFKTKVTKAIKQFLRRK